MDRYVIREPRTGADYPQGNQANAFAPNIVGSNNNVIPPPENIYYRSYGTEFSNIQRTPNLGYVGFSYMNSPQPFTSSTSLPPGQMLSGIDPRYLAGYSDNSAQFVITGQPIQGQSSTNNINFSVDYQNQNFTKVDTNNMTVLAQKASSTGQPIQGQSSTNNVNFGVDYQNQNFTKADTNNMTVLAQKASSTGQTIEGQNSIKNVTLGMDYQNKNFAGPDRIYNFRTVATPVNTPNPATFIGSPRNETAKVKQSNVHDCKNLKTDRKQEFQNDTCALQQKTTEKETVKNSRKDKSISRWNKFEVLYKRGLLVFSGPVEKVLKWHKSLQDTGVLALYEVVAKCVSVRPGESCAKNLVVRDENGPAMQVVYYEIDFHLPDLKLPCVVRVVGKMMVGTCRLQAFKVRPATGDDVAMLPRRAAVSAHHITKLSKEMGNI